MGEKRVSPIRQRIARQVLVAIGLFAAVVATATVAYWLEGWNVSDAFYMVIITVFGVGFGEVQPIDTPAERATTILSILAGTSATIYVVGSLIKVITEGEIQTAMAENRKLKNMDEMKRHTIICGFGRIGQTIARELQASSAAFLVIDKDPERIALSESMGYLTINGDAGDEVILGRARIDDALHLAAVLPNDMVNVFITLTARNLNPTLHILARAENPATEKKLRQAGANEVILPALSGGLQIAHRIVRPSLLGVLEGDITFIRNDLEELGVRMEEAAVAAGSHLAGAPLSQFIAGFDGRCIVLAIRRANGTSLQHPAHQVPLEAGDRIVSLIRKSS
jgi:voltage-gated potassium channel